MAQYRDSTPASDTWGELNRLFGASFRAGRLFGVEIRVLWLAVILFPLATLVTWTGMPPLMTFAAIVVYPLLLGVVIYSHEMGHIVAGWRYRIHTPLITLSPLGGLAHMGARAPGPRSDLVITLAGPAVHLLWLAVFWPLSRAFPPGYLLGWSWFLGHFLSFVVLVNLSLLIFNLLPIFPMDGGRALRALLSVRLHPNRATVIAARIGMVGAVGIGIYGVYRGGLWSAVMIALAFRIFMDCRRAAMEAKYGEGPFGRPREPWESDPDAWKLGADRSAPEPAAVRRESGARERRRLKREAREAAERAEMEAELDRVLERISAVGMDGLTPAERKFLKKASRRLEERRSR